MKKRNIFQNQSQELLHLFEAAGSSAKVMCVPMDYAKNFVSTLRCKGWLVANVNVHDAKTLRGNVQASTDRIDLMGIATMLLNCRANCCPAQSGIYRNLRTLVRRRRWKQNM